MRGIELSKAFLNMQSSFEKTLRRGLVTEYYA